LKYLLTPLLFACACAYGQSATTYMPEGTTDVDVGVAAALVPRAEGRGAERFVVVPIISAQWSNGVFAAPGEVGMHLSRHPRWDFGPLLSYGTRPQRADDKNSGGGWGAEAGGFLTYQVAHGLALSSRLLYGGGADRHGVRLTASANAGFELSSHQDVGFGLGFTAVNASYMDSYFGVARSRSQPGLPEYRAGAGMKNLFARARWNVELSSRYAVSTGVTVSRLAGAAADSPLVASPHNASLYTALSYHF
jgi:outer membrane scaffolding protein for murein synthesis (MipA/OmpV family)